MPSLRPILASVVVLCACGGDPAAVDEGGGGAGAGGMGTGGAGTGGTGTGGTATGTGTGAGGGGGGPMPNDDVRAYFYGHSLADFGAPDTQVGSAMCAVASTAGLPCCASGDWPQGLAPSAFAFYPYPPMGNQGHQPACLGAWGGSFADSNVNVVVITEANFLYVGEVGPSIQAGSDLVATLRGADPGLPIHLYEHWPELEGGLTYDAWRNGGHAPFHAWFAALQDGLNDAADPPIKLVPVGTVLTSLLADGGLLGGLTEAELFVDSAPHGTPTAYFLSGLVHHMALYRQPPPTDAAAIDALPGYLLPAVRDAYPAIVDAAWSTLSSLSDADGLSRVW